LLPTTGRDSGERLVQLSKKRFFGFFQVPVSGRRGLMKLSRIGLLALGLLLACTTPAMAYVGPGAGLTAIGAALAFLGAVVMALVGFVWYPLKRLLRARAVRKASKTPAGT
jgi:hypothetical protein